MILPRRGKNHTAYRVVVTRWSVRQGHADSGPTPPKNVSILNILVLLIGLIRLSMLIKLIPLVTLNRLSCCG